MPCKKMLAHAIWKTSCLMQVPTIQVRVCFQLDTGTGFWLCDHPTAWADIQCVHVPGMNMLLQARPAFDLWPCLPRSCKGKECVCVCVCARAHVRACVRACVRVRACSWDCTFFNARMACMCGSSLFSLLDTKMQPVKVRDETLSLFSLCSPPACNRNQVLIPICLAAASALGLVAVSLYTAYSTSDARCSERAASLLGMSLWLLQAPR